MSLKNIGGSGPLRPGNIFGKPQLPKPAPSSAKPEISRAPQGDHFNFGLEARQKISLAANDVPLPRVEASPSDQIRNAKNLGELVDNIFAKEFPGVKMSAEHTKKLKEFISGELERMGLDFDNLKKVL